MIDEYSEYNTSIIDLMFQVLEQENIAISCKLLMDDFLSPKYNMYKTYKSPKRKMTTAELKKYIAKEYLIDFVMMYKDTVIGKSNKESLRMQLEIAGLKTMYESSEESDFDNNYNDYHEEINNEFEDEVNILQSRIWDDVKIGEVYRKFIVNNYNYNGIIFDEIIICIERIQDIDTWIDDYKFDIEITAIILSVKESHRHFNMVFEKDGKFASAAMVNNHNTIDNFPSIDISIHTIVDSLLDMMYKKYGGTGV